MSNGNEDYRVGFGYSRRHLGVTRTRSLHVRRINVAQRPMVAPQEAKVKTDGM